DAQAWTGEWVAPDDLFWQAKRRADLTHLVLEQVAQRLDQAERQVFGQPDVVVRLDPSRRRGSVVAGALDDVRIQRALGQEIDPAELARFLGEDANELPADNAPLFLGVRNAR